MATKTLIRAKNLGLCEHCDSLLNINGMRPEAIDKKWVCPHCGKIISFASFGFEPIEAGFKKVRWVGSAGAWVTAAPTENFILGDWQVVADASEWVF